MATGGNQPMDAADMVNRMVINIDENTPVPVTDALPKNHCDVLSDNIRMSFTI
jgi:hypothetical protein